MLNVLRDLLRDPIWQGIASIIAIAATVFAIIKFFGLDSKIPIWQVILIVIAITAVFLAIKFFNKIREWWSILRKYPIFIFTHLFVLFIGIISGAVIIASQFTSVPTSTPTVTPEIYGTYEWQWAGENWYGRVTLGKQDGQDVISKARVGVVEKIVAPEKPDVIKMNGKVLELIEGTFDIKNNNAIEIRLKVDKMDRRAKTVVREEITGTLNRVSCYAGKVTYWGNEDGFEGDMVLVGYISTLGSVVNDWFREVSPTWFDYK